MAVIYFVQAPDGCVKIGRSASLGRLPQRMAEIQAHNSQQLVLLRAIVAEIEFERHVQHKFREYGLHGEWFRYHHDMMGDLGRPDAEGVQLGPIPLPGVPGNWTEAHRASHMRAIEERSARNAAWPARAAALGVCA